MCVFCTLRQNVLRVGRRRAKKKHNTGDNIDTSISQTVSTVAVFGELHDPTYIHVQHQTTNTAQSNCLHSRSASLSFFSLLQCIKVAGVCMLGLS